MAKIVVGVDGSEHSRPALAWAVEEARVRDAVLEVVLAWHEPYVGGLGEMPMPVDHEAIQASYEEELERILQESGTEGVPIIRRVLAHSAVGALLEAGEDADLLVVGSRGHGGFVGLLLGSVSQQVASHAPCPVVIVPGEDRR